MAPKPWTLILLLATLAASSSLLVTPPAAMAAQVDPFGFLSLVRYKKLCTGTSPRDIASTGVRRCAYQAVLAAAGGKRFPWHCCHALLAAATGDQKRCACDFVREAASKLKLDVNKDCQFLQKYVAPEFLFGTSADKFCARN